MTLIPTEDFTHRTFYTQKLFSRSRFCTQTLLHTDAFTHRSFYTQKLLHTEAFTQTLLHTQIIAHRSFLHADAFAHRSVYTQELLHKEAFAHRCFYTQERLHTDTFTRTFLHTEVSFYPSFGRSNLISCERVAPDACKSRFYHILPQFLAIEPHFYQNACEMQRFSKLQLSDRQRERPTGQRDNGNGTTGQRERDNETGSTEPILNQSRSK